MMPGLKAGFTLDARLEADSEQLMWLGLCELPDIQLQRSPDGVLRVVVSQGLSRQNDRPE